MTQSLVTINNLHNWMHGILTRTWTNTDAKGLLAMGSTLYISYNKNRTTILWMFNGSKSGCCKSISCKQLDNKKCYNDATHVVCVIQIS